MVVATRIGAGWLQYNPSLSDEVGGHYIPRVETKTRVEEYHFVLGLLKQANANNVLDLAAGYVKNWHKLPEIIADNVHAFVTAVDLNPQSLAMPAHSRIERICEDITSLLINNTNSSKLLTPYDAVICISSIEHMPESTRVKTIEVAAASLCAGGLCIITADNYPGINPEYLKKLMLFHFDVGDTDDHDDSEAGTVFPGGKRVAYCVGRKRISSYPPSADR